MRKRNILSLLTLLCLVAAVILSIGVAQARFRENWKENLPFQSADITALVLRQDGDWTTSGNQSTIGFSLENTEGESQQGEIYLLATLGIEQPERMEVALTVEGTTYIAQAQPIAEGSLLQKSFGDGWVYRFMDAQGQERTWPVGAKQQRTFQLTVKTDEEFSYHSLIRLVAK